MNQIHIFLNISTHCLRHKSQKSSSSDRRKFSPMPFVETFRFSLFFIIVIGLSLGYALIMKVYVIFLESIWQKDFLFPLKFSNVFKNINCFKKSTCHIRGSCVLYIWRWTGMYICTINIFLYWFFSLSINGDRFYT